MIYGQAMGKKKKKLRQEKGLESGEDHVRSGQASLRQTSECSQLCDSTLSSAKANTSKAADLQMSAFAHKGIRRRG